MDGSSTADGTATVVEFVQSTEIADAPEETVTATKRTVLDTLVAITAGHQLEETAAVTDYALETFADERDVTVMDGSGRRAGSEGAVFANAVAANALDIDEGHLGADGHPAALVVPAALAAAEEQNASIEEFLSAVLVGYEVAVRAGNVRPEVTGQHTGTGSWAPLGAAAAVGRLRGLSTDAMANALGIADFNAPITPILRSVATPGSGLTKDGIGWGALVGTVAVSMAQRGLQGSGTIFDETDADEVASLGEQYTVSNQYYKPYPGCRWTHAGIDAALELKDRYGFSGEDVETVRVHTFEYGMELSTREPATADAAEYSYPFMLATALVHGTPAPAHLQADARRDPLVLDVAEHIEFVHDEELEARYEDAWLARVEIETAEGTYESDVTHPRGSKERPMTDEEFRAKQQRLFDPHLGEGTSESVRTLVESADADARDLLDHWR